MKVAIYSRKSKLTDRGESIQNQIEMCRSYANTHFSISDDDIVIYQDEGYSGGNTERPEFKRLLQDAKNKKFNAVMCYKLDRISRNVLDFSNILEILMKHDISFVSITEHFDTTTPMGRAMVNIDAVFAQLERETIAERIKDNMHRLARTGRYLGSSPPTGFKAEKVEYVDHLGNKKKMNKLAHINDELEFVKLVYERYLELKSLCKVETWLMKNGHKNKNGNFIGTSEIRRLLTNPVYVKADESIFNYYTRIGTDVVNGINEFNGNSGMLLYGHHDRHNNYTDPKTWTAVLAHHHGIIESNDWLSVQNILEQNKNRVFRSGTSKKGLLSSKLKCANCGGIMTIIYGVNKNIHYYKCRNKIVSRKSICDIKNLNGINADQEIIDFLMDLTNDSDKLLTAINNKKRLPISDINYCNDEMIIKKELKEKASAIKNLTLRLRENENSSASKYIISDIENIDKEIQELNLKLLHINEREKNESPIDTLVEFNQLLPQLSFKEKLTFVDEIIDVIIWNGHSLTIYFCNSFD